MLYHTTVKNIKFKYIILCTTQKWQDLKNLEIWKYAYSDLQYCQFCVAQNTEYLKLIFCRLVGYTIGYLWSFFQKTNKYHFRIFLYGGSTGARVHKICTHNFKS